MGGHVRLHEERGLFRVNAQGNELCGARDGAVAQLLRILLHGDRVQVRDEVEGVIAVLQVNPLLQRSQVITQVIGISGGLDTGQDAGNGGIVCSHGALSYPLASPRGSLPSPAPPERGIEKIPCPIRQGMRRKDFRACGRWG